MAKAAKKAGKESTETASAAPKKAAKKAAAKAGDGEKQPKKANAGLMAPLTPSADLAKVVGSDQLPRTEIIKKIWDYIKEHGLQDKDNKRMINADGKLKKIFDGKEQISMFELAKVVSNHVK